MGQKLAPGADRIHFVLVFGSHGILRLYDSWFQCRVHRLVLVYYHVLSKLGWLSAACWDHLCGDSRKMEASVTMLTLCILAEFTFTSSY